MKLSENFTFEELVATDTGLPNDPGPAETQKLMYLANYVLQPVRDRWGPVTVTSGFRSHAVNERVGGSPTSQHRKGEACDIVPVEADLEEVYCWIVENSRISFGQCIYEKGEWIHVSLPRLSAPNGEALIFDGRQYGPYGDVSYKRRLL